MVLVCYVISQEHVIHAMWLYGQEPKVSNQATKFSGYRHSGSGVMILVWLAILKDYMIKRSCELMGGEPLMVSHHPD